MDNNSAADLLALSNMNNGNASWIWLILIFVVMFGMIGNRGPAAPAPAPLPMPNFVTQSEMNAAINNQTIQGQLSQIASATQQNNYETAQIINGQTNTLMQQNNTNNLTAVQGFNQIVNQLMQMTSQLGNKIDQLGYHMDQCCCEVKTQMLQDRLADRDRQLAVAQNDLSNARQSQQMLGAMGRWVGWSGSGSQALSTPTTAA